MHDWGNGRYQPERQFPQVLLWNWPFWGEIKVFLYFWDEIDGFAQFSTENYNERTILTNNINTYLDHFYIIIWISFRWPMKNCYFRTNYKSSLFFSPFSVKILTTWSDFILVVSVNFSVVLPKSVILTHFLIRQIGVLE